VTYQLGRCDEESQYRYLLTVKTDNSSGKKLIVIQCNPSNATDKVSDPTIGKVSKWAEDNNFSNIIFLNLFAYITPYTSDLKGKKYDELVGPNNDKVLLEQLVNRDCVVVLGWGQIKDIENNIFKERVRKVKQYIDNAGIQPYHVGALSGGRYPRHGRMWNKGNRNLSILDWADIIIQ